MPTISTVTSDRTHYPDRIMEDATDNTVSSTDQNDALALERKIAALEDDRGRDGKPQFEISKTSKLFDFISSDSLYTVPREEIQASVRIQLSPSMIGECRMPAPALSSSPRASILSPDEPLTPPAKISLTVSSRVTPGTEDTAQKKIEHLPIKVEQEHSQCSEAPASQAKSQSIISLPPTESILEQHHSSPESLHQDQTPGSEGLSSANSHPSLQPIQTQPTISSPTNSTQTRAKVDKFQIQDTQLSPALEGSEEEDVTRVVTCSIQSSSPPHSEPHPLPGIPLSNSVQPSVVHTVGAQANPLQVHDHETHVSQSHHPQQQNAILPTSSKPPTHDSAIKTDLHIARTGAEVAAGVNSRRPSTASTLTHTSARQWSDSMPTRPQPSRTTTQNTYVPILPLNKPLSREFSRTSTTSTTTTVVHPTGTMTSTLDPRGEVIAIDVDQPLDEAYVKKITHSLTELLEEYKSVSDHILKSLVLSTRNATDMCASTSGPGHGDYSKANGEAECIHVRTPIQQGPHEVLYNHTPLKKSDMNTRASKGKSKKNDPQPSSLEVDAIRQVELDRLPMPLYEGRPWPCDLLRRQQLALSVTEWIAACWARICALHNAGAKVSTYSVGKQRTKAIAVIKDAISTLWSLDSQFYEKSLVVIDILRDPDELEKENARLLKSQYLEILSDVSALPIAEIDNLDRLVNADHERFQKLTEPLDNIWVSLLMMESDSAKTSKTSSPRSFRETFSAFISSFLPAS